MGHLNQTKETSRDTVPHTKGGPVKKQKQTNQKQNKHNSNEKREAKDSL